MIVFVAHIQNSVSTVSSRRIVRALQQEYPEHCFIPAAAAFQHLYTGTFPDDIIFEIESDCLLSCDQLLIASKVSPIIEKEIELAQRVGLEVVYLADKYRTI